MKKKKKMRVWIAAESEVMGLSRPCLACGVYLSLEVRYVFR